MRHDAVQLVNAIDGLAPFPPVGLRVIELVQDEHTSAAGLADVLALEPVLTAKLLKVSNSAAWGRERHIGTVRDAVVLLGFEEVRQLALLTCAIANFGNARTVDDSFDIRPFWLHNVTVALAAERVACRTHAAAPGDAFTAGILHDIGRLVLRSALPGPFHDALVLQRQHGVPARDAELRTTGYAHDEVSRALGVRWQFPDRIVEAIGGHHRRDLSIAANGLSGIVAACDRLVLHHEGEQAGEDAGCDDETGLSAEWGALRLRAEAFIHAASGPGRVAA